MDYANGSLVFDSPILQDTCLRLRLTLASDLVGLPRAARGAFGPGPIGTMPSSSGRRLSSIDQIVMTIRAFLPANEAAYAAHETHDFDYRLSNIADVVLHINIWLQAATTMSQSCPVYYMSKKRTWQS